MSGGAEAGGRAEAGRRLVDEALRFVDAVRDTAGRPRPGSDPAGSADVFGFGDVLGADSGLGAPHTGPECRVCPVCRVLAAVRTLRPEAVEHLAIAAAELASAWREAVAGSRPEPGPPPGRDPEPSVQRIDVTD